MLESRFQPPMEIIINEYFSNAKKKATDYELHRRLKCLLSSNVLKLNYKAIAVKFPVSHPIFPDKVYHLVRVI